MRRPGEEYDDLGRRPVRGRIVSSRRRRRCIKIRSADCPLDRNGDRYVPNDGPELVITARRPADLVGDLVAQTADSRHAELDVLRLALAQPNGCRRPDLPK